MNLQWDKMVWFHVFSSHGLGAAQEQVPCKLRVRVLCQGGTGEEECGKVYAMCWLEWQTTDLSQTRRNERIRKNEAGWKNVDGPMIRDSGVAEWLLELCYRREWPGKTECCGWKMRRQHSDSGEVQLTTEESFPDTLTGDTPMNNLPIVQALLYLL